LTLLIAQVRYTNEDIELRRQVLDTIGDGQPVAVVQPFFDHLNQGWLFSTAKALYQAILLMAGHSQEERLARIYHSYQLDGWRRTTGDLVPNGQVKAANQVYATAQALADSPLLAGLVTARASIRSAAVLRLAGDRALVYRADTWTALAEAIDDWNGVGVVPQAVRALRVPVRPPSVLTTWNPATTVTTENLGASRYAFNRNWSNCGQTTVYLLSRLHDLNADVQLEEEFVVGQGAGEQLAAALLAPVPRLTLINVANEEFHEFTIEKRPNGQAVMQQGYIGQYHATWWAGLTDDLLQATGAAREGLLEDREIWGRNQVIDLDTLGQRLIPLLAAERLNSPAALLAWRNLPFNPRGAVPICENAPSFTVRFWSVNAPDTARGAVRHRLGMTTPTEWVSLLPIYEAHRFWQQIVTVATPPPEQVQGEGVGVVVKDLTEKENKNQDK
jgi:hypothetical protein